jgi:hypothetical protein
MSPRKSRNEGKNRFTLWLPEATTEQLERLQRAQGKGALAEVVRDAIEVYVSLLVARDRGVRLYFHDEKTGEEGRIWILPGPPPA